MVKDVICAEIPGTRRDVLNQLIKEEITGMPVVDREGNYKGIVTRQHIFKNPNEEQLAMLMDTSYPTVTPQTSVKTVAKLLSERRIFRVPVLSNGRLVGILGPADLLVLIDRENTQTPILEFLNEPCVPIWEETPVPVVAAIINITGAYAFPVLDNSAKLSGLVTDRDIFNRSEIGESVATTDLGLGDDEDAWSWEGMRNVMKLWYEVQSLALPNKPVREIMVKDPTTVYKMTSVATAAREMRRNDFGQLPVHDDDDKLLGMVYDLDVVQALL